MDYFLAEQISKFDTKKIKPLWDKFVPKGTVMDIDQIDLFYKEIKVDAATDLVVF